MLARSFANFSHFKPGSVGPVRDICIRKLFVMTVVFMYCHLYYSYNLHKRLFFTYYSGISLNGHSPNKGHCIKYLSTMDKTKSPIFYSPINIMLLEYLNRGQSLYSGQTT